MKTMRVLNYGQQLIGLLVAGWLIVQSPAAFSADPPKPDAPPPGIAAAVKSTGTESLPAGTLKKLDAQIVLALKKSRGEPPFDKPTSLQPDIPIQDAGRVLVDMEASVSKELLDQVALIGGQVINGSETTNTLRAMVPLSQLETLAGRADVKSISPARLTITAGVKAPQAPPAGSSKVRP